MSGYSVGPISGNRCVGGLIGKNGDVTSAGRQATAIHCYSVGPVTGQSSTGGLVGGNEAVVTGCLWDTQTSGLGTSAGGVGSRTAEMQTAKMFLDVGWDFADETKNGKTDIWGIDEGKDYPHLRWEKETP